MDLYPGQIWIKECADGLRSVNVIVLEYQIKIKSKQKETTGYKIIDIHDFRAYWENRSVSVYDHRWSEESLKRKLKDYTNNDLTILVRFGYSAKQYVMDLLECNVKNAEEQVRRDYDMWAKTFHRVKRFEEGAENYKGSTKKARQEKQEAWNKFSKTIGKTKRDTK